jgi:hypothetical protein
LCIEGEKPVLLVAADCHYAEKPLGVSAAVGAGCHRKALTCLDRCAHHRNFSTHSGPGDRRAERSQKAPASFLGMLQGKNFGKTLVRVAAQGINGAGG